MKSAALGAAVGLLLAGCGAHSSVPSRSNPPSPSSGSTSTAGALPFTPRRASVHVARWRLPVASARQALVPVRPGTVLLAGGMLAGDVSTDRVSRIDLSSGRITDEPPLAVPVHDVAGGLAGAVPLVVGGGNASEQDVVQELRGGAWRIVGHLPTTRSDLGAVSDGRALLVIGGYDGIGTPTAVLRLDRSGTASPHGRLRLGVRYAATAVAGRTAYVFGGEVLGRELRAVQAVDLATGRTRVVAQLPVPLGHAMAATVGDRILLLGGRVSPDRQTARMWWFDPGTRSFSSAGRLPSPLSDAAVTASGRQVWLLGGEDPAVSDRVLFVNVR